MDDLAGELKRLLPASEVLPAYGFQPDRGGFLQCPFHQGDDHGSLKVYDGDRGWHCFGCGRGGSVIDFVMELFGLSFHEACRKLNADFRLGLSDRRPTRAEASELLRRRQEERERLEREAEEYRHMAGEHQFWWAVKQQLEPQSAGDLDHIHPLYTEAVRRLPYLEWWLDEHLGAGGRRN